MDSITVEQLPENNRYQSQLAKRYNEFKNPDVAILNSESYDACRNSLYEKCCQNNVIMNYHIQIHGISFVYFDNTEDLIFYIEKEYPTNKNITVRVVYYSYKSKTFKINRSKVPGVQYDLFEKAA